LPIPDLDGVARKICIAVVYVEVTENIWLTSGDLAYNGDHC